MSHKLCNDIVQRTAGTCALGTLWSYAGWGGNNVRCIGGGRQCVILKGAADRIHPSHGPEVTHCRSFRHTVMYLHI